MICWRVGPCMTIPAALCCEVTRADAVKEAALAEAGNPGGGAGGDGGNWSGTTAGGGGGVPKSAGAVTPKDSSGVQEMPLALTDGAWPALPDGEESACMVVLAIPGTKLTGGALTLAGEAGLPGKTFGRMSWGLPKMTP